MEQKFRSLCILLSVVIHTYGFAEEGDNQFYFNFQGDQISIEQALSRYIQFESVSGEEKEAGEFLKNLCEQNGLFITQMGEQNGNYNFAASIQPLTKNLSNILFLNHIDVVPAGDSTKWSKPPFSGIITKDEIWGRGAFDNKGAAIMQLASIIEAKNLVQNYPDAYNVTFLAVSCEETQCDGGIKYVVENYFDQLNPCVIIGEGPPSLNNILQSDPEANIYGISLAHKRAFWLKLETTIETSGHGSITPLSYSNKELITALSPLINSKQKAIFNDLNIRLLKDLGQLEKGLLSFVFKHPRVFKWIIVPQLRKQPKLFALFSNTITLTSISCNNDVINSIPNTTTANLDCRLLPEESRDDFLVEIRNKINNELVKISVIYEMPRFKASNEESIFYKYLNNAITKAHPDGHVLKMFSPNFNDTGIFRAKGVPAFSTIPVQMDLKYLRTVHSYNERIPRGILNQGKNIYVDFIKNCLHSE